MPDTESPRTPDLRKMSLEEALSVFHHIATIANDEIKTMTSPADLAKIGDFTAALITLFPTIAFLQRPDPWVDINIRSESIRRDGTTLSSSESHNPHLKCFLEHDGIKYKASLSYTSRNPAVFPPQQELTQQNSQQTPTSIIVENWYGEWHPIFTFIYVFDRQNNYILLRQGAGPQLESRIDKGTLAEIFEPFEVQYLATGIRTVARTGLLMYTKATSSLESCPTRLLLSETDPSK